MLFLKRLIRNLVMLVVIGIVIYLLYPDIMSQVFQFFGAIYGPLLITGLVIVAAIPGKK